MLLMQLIVVALLLAKRASAICEDMGSQHTMGNLLQRQLRWGWPAGQGGPGVPADAFCHGSLLALTFLWVVALPLGLAVNWRARHHFATARRPPEQRSRMQRRRRLRQAVGAITIVGEAAYPVPE